MISDKTSSEISKFFSVINYIYYIIVFLMAVIFTIINNALFHIPLFVFCILLYIMGLVCCLKYKFSLELLILKINLVYIVLNIISNFVLIGRLPLPLVIAFVLIELNNLVWLLSRYSKIVHLIKEGRKIGW